MKTALFAAALMFAAPASATTWSDIGCGVGLISKGWTFQSISSAGRDVECKLTDATTLTCADGSAHKIETLPDNGIMMDGVRLVVLDGSDDSIVCD